MAKMLISVCGFVGITGDCSCGSRLFYVLMMRCSGYA